FNYDTAFEHSLPGNQDWYYEGLDTGASGLRVLKPHGSVNWAAPDEPDGAIAVVSGPDRSVVVAPTHLKFVQTADSATDGPGELAATSGYLDQSRQIQQVWAEMEREMRQSKALIF